MYNAILIAMSADGQGLHIRKLATILGNISER